LLPAGLARGYAANDKLNIGVIGLNRGRSDTKALNDIGQNIAALCDVDSKILDKIGAEYPKAKKYTDFRKMIEAEKLDGVVVATPDHLHAYISVWAMKHGINVYCEKPLAQNIHEARVMAKVAAETKVITQMGTSSTAEPRNLRTMELIQSGVLGEITEAHLSTDRPVWPQGFDRPEGQDPVPSTLDWDMWLGPAAKRPYQAVWPQGHPVYTPEQRKKFMYNKAPQLEVYHPFVWRGWTEFGSGAVGDIAPHHMNVIFMALDLGPPSAVEVVESSGMKKEVYPEWSVVRWDWPKRGIHPPFRIYWYDGGKVPPDHITGITQQPPQPGAPGTPLRSGVGGLIWIGTKGSLPQARGPYFDQKTEPYPIPPQKDWGREDVYKDWVAGVRTGKQPSCNFDYSGPFTEAFQLANVALRVGHRVEWDSLAFRVTNCQEANQYLRRDYRRGWDLKEIAGSAAFSV
jgi:predicted dehydrogenase